MTVPVAQREASTPQSQPLPPSQPRQANEQSLKRFKALVEREPEAPEPRTAAFEVQAPAKRRADLSEHGGNPFGEKASPMAATPPPAVLPPSSDAADRIAELQKASELALGLDRAHSRPTATQLLLTGEATIAGGTIAQGAAAGTMDIAIHPGSQFLTADSLDALRRRLAARGLVIGQLRLVPADEDANGASAI